MTFFEWVQTRLNVHGASLKVDGDPGAKTKMALRAFQARKNIFADARTTKQTVDALRQEPNGTVIIGAPEETMPVWLEEMTRRMGMHEVRDNKALSEWLRIGKYLGNPAELPWCGDAVESCFSKTLPDESVPSNPFWAQGWKNFGDYLATPKVGAVGVIRWSSRSGHVGFIINWTDKKICLRGGNQSNAINDRWFPRKKFIAYRWASTVPIKDYPKIKAGFVSADLKSTR